MANQIKVVAQYGWETVDSKDEALEMAKRLEENGYGVAKFQMIDDDGVWAEVSADEL